MTRLISALLAFTFTAAPSLVMAGGRDAMYFPKGKQEAPQLTDKSAKATNPANTKTKYKVQQGKAAPTQPAL